MMAGRMDRRIVIQTDTETQDSSTGEVTKTPVTFDTVWAERKDIRGGERQQSMQKLAARTATFRIRWLAGVTEQMRIIEAGTTWGITGIADNKREGWMELSCEAINPAAIEANT